MPSGFYIAGGRWLDTEHGSDQLFKVGHTGSLARRLTDSSYTTCFPPGHWAYAVTYELGSKEEAQLLESAVLHCCSAWRLGSTELVRLPLSQLDALAAGAALALALRPTRRERPTYESPERVKASPAGPGAAEPATEWSRKRALVEHLVVPVQIAAGTPDSFLGDLLEGDWLLELKLEAPPLAAPVLAVPARTPARAPAPAASAASAVPKKPVPLAPVRQPPKPAGDGDDELEAADLIDTECNPLDIQAASGLELREYQHEAADACVRELEANGRAVLQMACRCGKTPVAYEVVRRLLDAAPGAALILVPGLSLLRQTAQKLVSYGFGGPLLLVGSDPRPVALGGREQCMTTDPGSIEKFLAGAAPGPRLVVSTYQSSRLIPTDAFRVTVFDEAHRVCGGKAPRPFNHHLLAPAGQGLRLFQTATPAYDATAISMKDRALFGGVAYRYHLRQGILAGHVNDFRLEVVASAAPLTAKGVLSASTDEADAVCAEQVVRAMSQVDKLLVFCRDIGHAERLCSAVVVAAAGSGGSPFECHKAHSRNPGGAAAALRRLCAPGPRCALFNCRLFQEGVEIPPLNAVFFAAPRHSPRDIIQSLCRPLNAAAGKPPSVVFLPVVLDPRLAPGDPANLKRFASIVPFVDALLEEDPRLYDHLLDPAGQPYPVGVVGTRALGLEREEERMALLAAIRRVARYGAAGGKCERLLKVVNVPWAHGFSELRRVVHTLGRYPKTGKDMLVIGDARVKLYNIYCHYAEQYTLLRGGRPSKLEPWQAAALESLPGWVPYGVEGPYPWRECLATLEAWLAANGGVPPMCEIHTGGYVGLDATPMERLSGALTCINQGDGKARKGKPPGSGLIISAEKQADLDALCARWGLRWRKERKGLKGGGLGEILAGGPKTFIQEGYARFLALYKAKGAGDSFIATHFPGYPNKHRKQESLTVQAQGIAPPPTGRPRRRMPAAPKSGSV